MKCRFSGTLPKEQFYPILELIDKMKINGWNFLKHDRSDDEEGNISYYYELVKNGANGKEKDFTV